MQSLVALVTGGASGLGLSLCKRLASKGMRVISLDLQSDKLKAENNENIISIKGDVRKEEDVLKALDFCQNNNKKQLNILVNCAGVANAFKIYNFESKRAQRLEDFKELFEINVFGTFNTIRLSAHLLAQNPISQKGTKGVIINTSSILATDGHEGQVGYSASQMAIQSMTLPLARDLSSQQIRCNCIAVGFFATPLVLRCDSPELQDFLKMTTPCPSRLGEPQEFASIVENIISNDMINGEIIRIDGACRWPERG